MLVSPQRVNELVFQNDLYVIFLTSYVIMIKVVIKKIDIAFINTTFLYFYHISLLFYFVLYFSLMVTILMRNLMIGDFILNWWFTSKYLFLYLIYQLVNFFISNISISKLVILYAVGNIRVNWCYNIKLVII